MTTTMIPRLIGRLAIGILVSLPGVSGVFAWSTYRGDSGRSSYADVVLGDELRCRWQVQVTCARAVPAWSGRDTRMPFDVVCRPVLGDGLLLFGSSAEGTLNALDAKTGSLRWRYVCEGPVRLAPAVAGGKVYVVSDDGRLACVRLADGELLWSHRPVDFDSLVLGNRHMISRWPARGGPVVENGVVYYAAGIWPSEGIFVCAVEAETGKLVWCNQEAGRMFIPQPHPTAVARSGISVQGHLVLQGGNLLVPTGRAVPAVLAADTGVLKYFRLQENGHRGGSEITALTDEWFNNGCFYAAANGNLLAATGFPLIAVSPDRVFLANTTRMEARDRTRLWVNKAIRDRLGKVVTQRVLAVPIWQRQEKNWTICSVAATRNRLVLGGRNKIDLLDSKDGRTVGSAAVDGRALGLAVGEDGIFVITDKGSISCWTNSTGAKQAEKPVWKAAAIEEKGESVAAQCARRIREATGVTKGYCLDWRCGSADLALALARQSELTVIAADYRPEKIRRARERLLAAGVLGSRVMLVTTDRNGNSLPNGFAELFVSRESLLGRAKSVPRSFIDRVVSPWLGVSCLTLVPKAEVLHRGPPEGVVGCWTHIYADAANTNCSGDETVQGPLGMLWFDDWAFTMPSRHGRGTAPLFYEGRLFVEGLNGVLCVNAYNGRPLWQAEFPGIQRSYDQEHILGVAGTGGGMCMDANGLYVRRRHQCIRMDPKTGRLLGTFSTPPGADGVSPPWGYIAVEGGWVYGSSADPNHVVKWPFVKGDMSRQLTESKELFALDPVDGKRRWSYKAQYSIRHNAVALGGGRVYLMDRPQALFDRKWRAADRKIPATEKLIHPPGTVIALDARTGKEQWRSKNGGFATVLTLSTAYDVLLMSCLPTRFSLRSEGVHRMAAIRASDGTLLWDKTLSYASRPNLVGRTIYAQPGAWDLLTGEPTGFTLRGRSYGCGTLAASRTLLTYRSATLGYTDLTCNLGTENYGGFRPGCWINALPVGGLVLVPDATDRCRCSYLIKSSVGLRRFGLRAPQPRPGAGIYPGPVDIHFEAVPAGVRIRYTLDGSVPTRTSSLVEGNVRIDADCLLQCRAFQAGSPPGPVTRARYRFNAYAIP